MREKERETQEERNSERKRERANCDKGSLKGRESESKRGRVREGVGERQKE